MSTGQAHLRGPLPESRLTALPQSPAFGDPSPNRASRRSHTTRATPLAGPPASRLRPELRHGSEIAPYALLAPAMGQATGPARCPGGSRGTTRASPSITREEAGTTGPDGTAVRRASAGQNGGRGWDHWGIWATWDIG